MLNESKLTDSEFYNLTFSAVKLNELMSTQMVESIDEKLTKIQVGILIEVNDSQPLSITDLSKQLNMNYGNTSSQCKALEKKGYLLRKRDPEDERYVKLYISDEGTNMLDEMYEWLNSFMEEITADYTKEEWEKISEHTRTLYSLIQKATTKLERNQ